MKKLTAKEFYKKYARIKMPDGTTVKPEWRDVDEHIFDFIDKVRKSGKNLMYFKRKPGP